MFGFTKKDPRPVGQIAINLQVTSFDILPSESTRSDGRIPAGASSPYRVNMVDDQKRRYYLIYYVRSLPPDAYQNYTLDQIRKSDMRKGSWYSVTGDFAADGAIVLGETGLITPLKP